ncbi:unnamed protein product [Ranitomeya imitator]|uniref:Laminin EGF-like domain-containing protein n=1 Tax=Ranitomeya imitator TaxID=111125 RepID=A0ABN9L073_9NEOB|nr:unnamed protein product [Ranitomeya imitator]
MIQARKPSSSRIYYRTWKAYFRWCESNRLPPMVFSLPSLLAFLQAGLDSGLALSSLKGQVAALSILFQKTLASRPQVKTFFQGVAHVVPPYRAPVEAWDLNLVLDVLKVSPFEPLREIPLSALSWKVAFLVAITSIRRVSELAALSCRPPFLVIHQDKVVFRPPPSFLPKVVSTFHLNEDIVLPSFCPAPTHPLERSLNKLDLVRAVRIYLDRTSTFRKTDSFFVIPDGTRRGQPASKATIARWIRMAILEAYQVKNRVPPPGIKAHSTRAVGASWAVHHRASALQLCKAATWSSIHTFAKFYKVHTYASADASLGRRILQAAVESILLVPVDSYTHDILLEKPLDKSFDFINICGENSFYVDHFSSPEFCTTSARSLVAYYNDGAVPCGCHAEGSTNPVCNPFGGQCTCRPNIIGRTCSRCATGYYGFPHCRSCTCGHRLCDEITGKCICPPQTVKPMCEVCEQHTFSYHPLLGCEGCNCSSTGVIQPLRPECDSTSGQCRSLPASGPGVSALTEQAERRRREDGGAGKMERRPAAGTRTGAELQSSGMALHSVWSRAVWFHSWFASGCQK